MATTKFYALIFKKLWGVLLFSFVCTALVAMVLFVLIPVQYESGTTLYISNKNFEAGEEITYSDMLASRSLVENYAQIIKSSMFAEGLIDKLGLKGVFPVQLSTQIETRALANSNVLDIKIRYPDKASSERIAAVLPLVLYEKSSMISNARHVTVLNRPTGARPFIAGRIIAVISTFILALLLSIGFLIVLHRGNNIIRTPEDVEKHLGLTVTGTIPDFKI